MNNQGEKMTWPIVISTSVLPQLVHEPMVCMVAGEEAIHDLNSMESHLLRLIKFLWQSDAQNTINRNQIVYP